jgi:hypothetical protein
MLDQAPVIALLFIAISSFLLGYGVRELISQRRRMSTRRHYVR